MNGRLCQGEASVYPMVIFETNSTTPSEKSSALDDTTHRRCIALEQLYQQSFHG
jgi:hypothetical protein